MPKTTRLHAVPCPGYAHWPEGALIDNCTVCAPRWGTVIVPAECKSVGAYIDWLDADNAAPSKRAIKAFAKTLDDVDDRAERRATVRALLDKAGEP